MTSVLTVTELEKSYGALKATDGVSLAVNKGEIHALIGPNGAGKTTLVSQIYGSLIPDRGHILLNGEDITRLDVVNRVKRGLARSFQITSVLMGFSVIENVMIAGFARRQQAFRFFTPAFAEAEIRDEALAILQKVSLDQQQNTVVAELSHGERRLLELALVMIMRPAMLLLDEPMAGAGTDESDRMTALIAELRKDSSILLIEHDMDAVFQLADRITVLVEGKVIASGTAEEISNDEAVRSAYLGAE